MLVVCGNTFGAWVLLVIAIMCRVGIWMEVVGREHKAHSQEGLSSLREKPEYFLSTKWGHCLCMIVRISSQIFVWQS